MLPNWNDLGAAEERRRAMLREAEARRAAVSVERSGRQRAPARPGPAARALGRLGRLMMAWGARLQELEVEPTRRA